MNKQNHCHRLMRSLLTDLYFTIQITKTLFRDFFASKRTENVIRKTKHY